MMDVLCFGKCDLRSLQRSELLCVCELTSNWGWETRAESLFGMHESAHAFLAQTLNGSCKWIFHSQHVHIRKGEGH